MDVRKKIIEIAQANKSFKVSNIVEALGGKVSRQYVARIVSDLVSKNKIIKGGSTKQSTYALPKNAAYLGKSLQKR